MADQELLARYAPTIDSPETKEAYLLDGELYIRHESATRPSSKRA